MSCRTIMMTMRCYSFHRSPPPKNTAPAGNSATKTTADLDATALPEVATVTPAVKTTTTLVSSDTATTVSTITTTMVDMIRNGRSRGQDCTCGVRTTGTRKRRRRQQQQQQQ
mmetsp:Transcript_37554/g.91277  ORF Transcript_37554/g.91277 Transcript_37554/m.91277 type:complete len:112 (+) Transcript_37554:103-438(+)